MFPKCLLVLIPSIMIALSAFVQPASASTFGDYESAVFLAKLAEVKVATDQIANHAGDQDAINYYQGLLEGYWTPKETKELAERNPQIAEAIVSDINATISDAKAGNSNMAQSDFFDIAGYLEQAGAVGVDPITFHNATVQATSITMVLRESLERYGDAAGSPGLGVDTSNPGVGLGSPGSPVPAKIVNGYAHDLSKEMAGEGLDMFGQLITHDPRPPYSDRIAASLNKYVGDIGNKADTGTVLSDVYSGAYPNFVLGYGVDLKSIPEFPFPSAMILSVVSAMILVTRLATKRLSLLK